MGDAANASSLRNDEGEGSASAAAVVSATAYRVGMDLRSIREGGYISRENGQNNVHLSLTRTGRD